MNDTNAFAIRHESQDGATSQQGFYIRFANGYQISVQFGAGNYSDWGKTTAEVAVFTPDGDLVELGKYDDVLGHVKPERVAELIFEFSMIKKEEVIK